MLSYLERWPLALVALSILYILFAYLIEYLYPSPYIYVTSSSLISPEGDKDLSRLEAETIISSLASSILPPHLPSTGVGAGRSGTNLNREPEKPLPTKEAEEVVEEFKSAEKRDSGTRYREWIAWTVGVGGAVVWLVVEGARAFEEGRWTRCIFPVSHATQNCVGHQLCGI